MFSSQALRLWDRLPRVIREANSVEALKSRLTVYLILLPGRGVLQFLLLPQVRQRLMSEPTVESPVRAASWIQRLHALRLPGAERLCSE